MKTRILASISLQALDERCSSPSEVIYPRSLWFKEGPKSIPPNSADTVLAIPEVYEERKVDRKRGSYTGSILRVVGKWIIQDVGRLTVAVHNKADLEMIMIPQPSLFVNIKYDNGRGTVQIGAVIIEQRGRV
jgi:hypothetical protein